MTLKCCIHQLLLQWCCITNIPKWGSLRQQLFILDDASADPLVGSWSRVASAGVGSRVHICVSHPLWISRLRRTCSQDGGRRAMGWAERDEFSYSLGLVLAHCGFWTYFIEQSTSHVEANIHGAEKYTRYTLFIVEATAKSRGKVHRYREGEDLGTVVLFITSGS